MRQPSYIERNPFDPKLYNIFVYFEHNLFVPTRRIPALSNKTFSFLPNAAQLYRTQTFRSYPTQPSYIEHKLFVPTQRSPAISNTSFSFLPEATQLYRTQTFRSYPTQPSYIEHKRFVPTQRSPAISNTSFSFLPEAAQLYRTQPFRSYHEVAQLYRTQPFRSYPTQPSYIEHKLFVPSRGSPVISSTTFSFLVSYLRQSSYIEHKRFIPTWSSLAISNTNISFLPEAARLYRTQTFRSYLRQHFFLLLMRLDLPLDPHVRNRNSWSNTSPAHIVPWGWAISPSSPWGRGQPLVTGWPTFPIPCHRNTSNFQDIFEIFTSSDFGECLPKIITGLKFPTELQHFKSQVLYNPKTSRSSQMYFKDKNVRP